MIRGFVGWSANSHRQIRILDHHDVLEGGQQPLPDYSLSLQLAPSSMDVNLDVCQSCPSASLSRVLLGGVHPGIDYFSD